MRILDIDNPPVVEDGDPQAGLVAFYVEMRRSNQVQFLRHLEKLEETHAKRLAAWKSTERVVDGKVTDAGIERALELVVEMIRDRRQSNGV